MKILVIRFSAMGDVALIAPLAHVLLKEHPSVNITILTRPHFIPLFYGNSRLSAIGVDIDSTYKGVLGLLRLYNQLKHTDYDLIIDLHDNIRSRLLSGFFRVSGTRIVRYDKRRSDRKKLLKDGISSTSSMPHTTELYRNAFLLAGLNSNLSLQPLQSPLDWSIVKTKLDIDLDDTNKLLIGIAPFAKHSSKMWPIEKIHLLINKISVKYPGTSFFIFGGGDQELIEIDKLIVDLPTAYNVGRLLNLEAQLTLMSQLGIMISMDSSNMHMAALMGTKVISIWGSTHPAFGFYPLFNEGNMILPNAGYKPVSIFGKVDNSQQLELSVKAMDSITVDRVFERVKLLLGGNYK